jgi:anthranilate phosphoribosyltransferase
MTGASATSWFTDALPVLIARQELTNEQMRAGLAAMVEGRASDAEAAAFLVGLRMKGETAAEIAAAATVLREHMVRWDPGPTPVLDTCGTGGDGACTFNISTATAFVAAAAGIPVVKHGNRSTSSRSGSIDVLAKLEIDVAKDAATARRSLDRFGLAFCSAPSFHPALKQVAGLRRLLGVATLFNWVGPLLNPAGAQHQLLGVGRSELLDLLAAALVRLGTKRAVVVCSRDGLDEVALSAATSIREIQGCHIASAEWTPADFGLERCTLEDLRVNGPEASAALIRQVLAGDRGPATRVVLANSAAALLAAEKVKTLAEGVDLASAIVFGGKALALFEKMRAGAQETTKPS